LEEILIGILALLGGGLAIWFTVWIFFLLPAEMAEERNRDPTVWVLISLVGSPFLAILLLIALGDVKD